MTNKLISRLRNWGRFRRPVCVHNGNEMRGMDPRSMARHLTCSQVLASDTSMILARHLWLLEL